MRRFVETVSPRPSLSWDDLGFLCDEHGSILLKGILHPADAAAAVERGMDGIVVSNHGGRQVDGAIATMDALPGSWMPSPVAFRSCSDSGIRSGADVSPVKLALGASAVGLGRPYVWGLAAGGEEGAREVIRNMRADFDLTMVSLGSPRCATSGRTTSRAFARRGRRFDLDGVLVDFDDIWHEVREGLARERGGAGPIIRRRT